MKAADLALLLDEANHAPWESVRAALAMVDGQPHPRIGWLIMHLAETKRNYWAAIAEVTGCPVPPDDMGLTRLMSWEIETTRALSPEALALPQTYQEGGTVQEGGMVASLLRLNARHTVWHAGQIAALTRQTRLA